ncbi:hypothetical protein TRVL_07071 [Trypanosoma vivax]|nr:hypothetical protein TRVL_07071 [Trypanosoma vivax]
MDSICFTTRVCEQCCRNSASSKGIRTWVTAVTNGKVLLPDLQQRHVTKTLCDDCIGLQSARACTQRGTATNNMHQHIKWLVGIESFALESNFTTHASGTMVFGTVPLVHALLVAFYDPLDLPLFVWLVCIQIALFARSHPLKTQKPPKR